MPKLSIIVSYYKQPRNLEIILEALKRQKFKDFEVILSEDDNNPQTLQFVRRIRNALSFPLLHIYREADKGFRKNEMLNKAVKISRTENLVFIDGDCVPHPYFTSEYFRNFEEGKILSGRSVMLDEKTTKKLLEKQDWKVLNWKKLLRTSSEKIKEGIYFPYFPLYWKVRGLVGRNWGVMKKHLVAVNGFDNDYVFAGVGEDVDIEWRLKASGLIPKSVKNKAIVFHLYHPKGYSEKFVQKNYELLQKKQKEGHIVCLNGLNEVSEPLVNI